MAAVTVCINRGDALVTVQFGTDTGEDGQEENHVGVHTFNYLFLNRKKIKKRGKIHRDETLSAMLAKSGDE